MDLLDDFDLKILKEVQRDGAITHARLAEQVHLSASQCARRVQRLENLGVIDRYTAVLSRDRLKLGVTAYVMVSLSSHSAENLEGFRSLIMGLPEVLDCAKITGDADYLVKMITTDLARYNSIITENFLRAVEVSKVRSSIVLEELKSTFEMPLPTLDVLNGA
jgi:Lrp/AsnC family leucine-responsive transcriptional regulator